MTTKEIETYLLLHEQKIQDFVKTRSRNWLIAAGIAFILLIVLFVTVFRHKTLTNDAYESQINALDSTIKYQQKTIESLQRFNAQQDSTIQTLNEKYKANRPTETRIIHQYETIPNTVNNLDKSQLRREVSEFQ